MTSTLDLSKLGEEYSRHHSPELQSMIQEPQNHNQRDVVEVRTGSDSDFPKIEAYLSTLREAHIPYWLTILSAHRTPEDMAESARAFPSVLLHRDIRKIADTTGLRVKFGVGAAGGSAYIAGMSASETQTPFVALPVMSSACGLDDASLSMIQMPPHKPNGFVPNNEVGGQISKQLFEMELGEGCNKVSGLNPAELSDSDRKLLEKLGLELDSSNDSPIKISTQDLNSAPENKASKEPFNIFIPMKDGATVQVFEMLEKIRNYDTAGVFMGMQNIEGQTNFTNAIIYAAQILGMFNPDIRRKAEIHSSDLGYEVSQKRLAGELQQLGISPEDIVTLPPHYKHLYSGKVRETYEYPGHPEYMIMIATDRISTHDVIHNGQIPGKGKALTQISNYWFKKLRENDSTKDIPTHIAEDMDFPEDFPEHLKSRAMIVKNITPLPVEAIERGFFYGSIMDGYDKKTGILKTGEVIEKGLEKCSEFAQPRFTPSTKSEKGDVNITYDQMKTVIGAWLIENNRTDLDAEKIAETIKDYSRRIYDFCKKEAQEKGYTLADTKFEFGIDTDGNVVLIDEVCTPDSSRFWLTVSIKVGEEPESADKQPTRNEVDKIWKTVPDSEGRVKPEKGDSTDGWKKYPVHLTPEVKSDGSKRYGKMEKLFHI